MKQTHKQILSILLFACIATFIYLFFYYFLYEQLYTHFTYLPPVDRNESMKYILLWTDANTIPFETLGKGHEIFAKRNCTYTNCYVTDSRNYFDTYLLFHAIVFAWPQIFQKRIALPQWRSPYQKFIFASIESPVYYPLCDVQYNAYFNWTWTYKLDSDMRWEYIDVLDHKGNIIGPKKDMQWLDFEQMSPIDNDLKSVLAKKTKAAAWFVSNCKSKSKREKFVQRLQKELEKFNFSVDIYGRCGPLKCPPNEEDCTKKLETDYFFYLSFENSFAEDYVTEKLLTALQHNTVPIVYGGANYTRFLPDNVYLNARTLGAEKLAVAMKHLIDNPDEYEKLFRWKNHYSYRARSESPESDAVCNICAMLNDKTKVESYSVIDHIVEWWTPAGICSKR